MSYPLGRRADCLCTMCGQALAPGEEYWYINGAVICGACLGHYARLELAPFRHVLGEERGEG